MTRPSRSLATVGGVLAALAGLAVVCTALAFLVFFALIREAGPSRALVFTYVNPAVAVAAGVLFLDEPLTGTIVAAFVLILCGSVLATGSRRRPDLPPEPEPEPEADLRSEEARAEPHA